MTTTSLDPALVEACRQADLSPDGAEPLREHATTVYLLPRERVVARISREQGDMERAQTAVALTHWLDQQGLPVTAPAIDHPIATDEAIVTFWIYHPQDPSYATPGAGYLGATLSHLHLLPEPPVQLKPYRPLESLGRALSASQSLSEADRTWLLDRRTELIERYHHLESSLGTGLVHGDAYPGNMLWGADGPLLGDWDEAALAPRELDLVNTYQGVRFGRPQAELDAFTREYGWDVRDWAGFPVLREMRDMHTLASYIRLADAGHATAQEELHHRVRTLRDGDTQARWNAR